jgi:1,4-dihydroxy-2-naphthoate octaprenyltransferase
VAVVVCWAAAGLGAESRPGPVVAALVAAVLIQIGTNFANDYFDFQKGADTVARLGPARVTQSGLIPAYAVRWATALTFGLAALVGLYLVVVGGWPILLIGLLSIAAGVLYTGGPWPLGYHGLGDLFVFVFFGLVAVVGSAYLQLGAVSARAAWAALPVACLVTAILVVNNLRDIETDRQAGKHTLAVRLGRGGTRLEYVLLLAAAYLTPLLGWLASFVSGWFWLPWLTLPLALKVQRVVAREAGRPLNAALKGTAQLHLAFGLLFAVSLWL